MTVELDSHLLKAGNDMAGALLEIETLLRLGIPLTQELSLTVLEMIDVAVDHWREAVAPSDEA
jgi:hypothetical protein